jgi:hypothetical protein
LIKEVDYNKVKPNMIKQYAHTQKGILIIIAILAAIVLISAIMIAAGINWITIAVLIILFAVLALFSKLTVIIWQDKLEVRFGPGLIRKYFKLEEIISCRIVKNPWYYGWGIRITPNGSLYNVSGFYAVEIALITGSKFRIGTDVPDELKNAIDLALRAYARS